MGGPDVELGGEQGLHWPAEELAGPLELILLRLLLAPALWASPMADPMDKLTVDSDGVTATLKNSMALVTAQSGVLSSATKR